MASPGEPITRAVEFMTDAHALAIKHHGKAGLDFELALSAAYEGIFYGLRTFNPGKGVTLRSYVNHKIEFAIYDEARRWDKRGRPLRFVTLKGHELTYNPTPSPLDEEAARELLYQVFDKLNARQKSVLQLRLRGFTGVRIAKRLGITRGRVSQLLKQIRTIWREH